MLAEACTTSSSFNSAMMVGVRIGSSGVFPPSSSAPTCPSELDPHPNSLPGIGGAVMSDGRGVDDAIREAGGC
jgi:hypothetical protein